MGSFRLAIIDSGVRINHPAFLNKQVCGYSLIVNSDGDVIKKKEFDDLIGHGTAIYYLIDKNVDGVEIVNIKIFDDKNQIKSQQFELILNYIYNNDYFDVINISMGIINYGNVDRLKEICNAFHEKGTIIVSAFDNNGAVSFPAALDNVIGVDAMDLDIDRDKYMYVENSIVNIIGKRSNMRVAWINPDYISVNGSSFTCANVTTQIIKTLKEKNKFNIQDICTSILTFDIPKQNKICFKINKAAIFPFNKEIHAIARYEDLLSFQVVDFYSSRITGQVGKEISQIVDNSQSKRVIKNIDEIDWDAFDTLILGHFFELEKLTKVDYFEKLVKKAIEKNKNIYSFEDIPNIDFYNNFYTPKIDASIIKKRFGKLYITDKPILTIAGTNSRQGKFTLQLYLRKKLIEMGYNVGQIGTEPSSILFDIDEVFACGYNSKMQLEPSQICSVINQMVWDISQKDVDIIISGSQSGLLAYNDRNISMLPFQHQIFFESLQTDAIIICINAFDNIDFVERVVKTAEGLSGGKVIGIACFPIDFMEGWKSFFGGKSRISIEKEELIKEQYLKKLNLKVYMLDKQNELDELLNECINYFQ